MANRWLRGVLPTHDPVGTSNNYLNHKREFATLVFYFLWKVLEFTYVDSSATSGSWNNNHSASGTDGSFTGTSLTFTSASATFVVGDVGKFLCLVDSTSDKNCGIYVITGFTDANNVVIDFYTTGGNYPDASTGIDWYLLDPTNVPSGSQDYFVLQSPHSTVPVTIKGNILDFSDSGNNVGGGVNFLVAGQPASEAWDTVGHDWKAGVKRTTTYQSISAGEHNSNPKGKLYAYGNPDGSSFCLWTHFDGGTGNKAIMFFSVLDPFESGRTSAEKFCIHGPRENQGEPNSSFDIGDDDFGKGLVWSERGQTQLRSYVAGYCLNGNADYFRTDTGGPNARTGKRDALPMWVFGDPTVSAQAWAPYGEVSQDIVRAQVIDLGEHATFDSDQYLHIREGLTVPWPGIPFVP